MYCVDGELHLKLQSKWVLRIFISPETNVSYIRQQDIQVKAYSLMEFDIIYIVMMTNCTLSNNCFLQNDSDVFILYFFYIITNMLPVMD